jgi:hypothetical protein
MLVHGVGDIIVQIETVTPSIVVNGMLINELERELSQVIIHCRGFFSHNRSPPNVVQPLTDAPLSIV